MSGQTTRLHLEVNEYARRLGPRTPEDRRNWTLSYHAKIAFEQARSERSQFEWFARATPSDLTRGTGT